MKRQKAEIQAELRRRTAGTVLCLFLLLLLCGCGAVPGESNSAGSASLPEVGPVLGESAVNGPTAPEETAPAETAETSFETFNGETEPETEATATVPAETALPETEAPETTAETPAPETSSAVKPGLWDPVPTEAADWATRAVSEQIYTNADFGWSTYQSSRDRDGDGIEDQRDILQGARDYVATRPVYDTREWPGGWPPAGYGVCTDVAAYALKAAGYDLKAMLDADIAAHPGDYPEGTGDRDIDFRRTRNLLPFFRKYSENLTLDPYDYEAWQPGDIVIFASPSHGMSPGHIAVVSDRRASDGLPYLIHHTSNDGYSYEEDYLTTPRRIIAGHFRVNGFPGADR